MGLRFQLILLFAICSITTAWANIIVDGEFDDWPADSVYVLDPSNDAPYAGPEFKRLDVTNDAYNLYLKVEFTEPVNVRYIDLKLELDADNDATTGNSEGMDFIWDFDRNRGTSTLTSRDEIGRGNLIQRIAPDATSRLHEIAISLEALPAAGKREPIRILLSEENSRDRIPNSGVELAYTVEGPLAVQGMPIQHTKRQTALRIVSWNVLRDAAFKSQNLQATLRILTALQPDIVMFQEIYDAPLQTVLDFFQENLQLPSGYQWSAVRKHDCITVSRFPILDSWPSDNNVISRHDTAELIGCDLLIANAHLPCCTNGESGRVEESATMLNILDPIMSAPGDTPLGLIIGGDLNSGGIAPELLLLSNDLIPFEMASPRHLYWHDQYTWGSQGSFWGSSRLDFLLFDKERLFRDKAFILDTDTLPSAALQEMGLEADDTFISDHLPLVFDVRSPFLPGNWSDEPMAPDGSTTSSRLGAVNGMEFPWVYQMDLGWLYIPTGSDGWLWINQPAVPPNQPSGLLY
ncbi:MAG: endonuclease/exonuclease/phosphatase family protein [Puniceicoccaceae bacterium]